MMRYSKNIRKERQIQDIAFIGAVIFVISFSFLFGSAFLNKIDDAVTENPGLASAAGEAALTEYTEQYNTTGDYVIIIVLVLSFFFSLVSAFFIQSNPVFFVISVLVWIFIIALVIPIYANIYLYAATIGDLSVAALEYPITNYVMNNYVLIVSGLSLLIFIALYSKSGDQ